MRLIAAVFCYLIACAAALAASTAEEEALGLFEAACLHDEGQFDKALALAAERSMAVPPDVLRQTLVDKGEGAVWLAQAEPVLVLHANLSGGCGIFLKPADEDRIEDTADNLAGADLVYDDAFQRAWTRWYVLKRDTMQGVLIVGYFGDSEKPSAFLRYLPSTDFSSDPKVFRFLLSDIKAQRAIRKSLKK